MKDWQIDIINEDSETYTKFLILVQKYEHNTNLYRDTLLNCECNKCRYIHFIDIVNIIFVLNVIPIRTLLKKLVLCAEDTNHLLTI